MDTIRKYLEAMFANLPSTPEVIRAKDELWQMMEDKYNELRAEGRNENEAVGTVIAEFGNLDELAESLGVEQAVEQSRELMVIEPRRMLRMDEVCDFLRANMAKGVMIGFGVMLCIACPVWPILLGDTFLGGFSILLLLAMVAMAVGLFVFAGVRSARWRYLDKELCETDYATTEYIAAEKERYKASLTGQLVFGILFCATCWVPIMVLSEMGLDRFEFVENLGAVILLLLVGFGVFLIVNSSIVRGGFEKLLKLNKADTMSARYVKEQQPVYDSEKAANVMSVYWPTVVCLYLSWSFLTFAWATSWIIWPIAGILHSSLKRRFGKRAL